MHICAIIVTYNRKELLLRNVKNILAQTYPIDKIYIIDNHSADNSEEYLTAAVESDRIDYSYLDENIGGAGGFWYGLKKSHESKYDWYILMDDDGMPADDKCFENMVCYIKRQELSSDKSCLLNCLVIAENDDNKLAFELDGIDATQEVISMARDGAIKGDINPFNGTFVSNGLVDAIGYPNKDFFIKGDESDYERRAKEAEAYVATVIDSVYKHPSVKNNVKKRIFGHTVDVFVEAPWKEYYSTRNYIYSILHSKISDKEKKRRVRRFLLKKYYCVLNAKCHKIKTLKMIRLGAKHGKKGILGSTIKP